MWVAQRARFGMETDWAKATRGSNIPDAVDPTSSMLISHALRRVRTDEPRVARTMTVSFVLAGRPRVQEAAGRSRTVSVSLHRQPGCQDHLLTRGFAPPPHGGVFFFLKGFFPHFFFSAPFTTPPPPTS